MSDLVGNPEDRFSLVAVYLVKASCMANFGSNIPTIHVLMNNKENC